MSSLTFLRLKAANKFIMHWSSQAPDSLPYSEDQKSLTLCWPSLSEQCRERVAFLFDHKGGLYRICECQQPITTQITEEAGRKIIDTPLTLTFKIGKLGCVAFSWIDRWPKHRNWTTMYQRQYAAINSRISECNHKSKKPITWTSDWNWRI